jgi:hypothetical protein
MISALGAIGIGSALGIGGSLLKKKPKIPTYKPVSQQGQQEAAIAANLASFNRARELAQQTSQADQDTLDSLLSRVDPNYQQNISRASGVIGDFLAGRLPLSDQNVSMRKSAESSQLGGVPGSRFAQATTARDLGLSQVDLMRTGLGAFNQFSTNLRSNYVANPMPTASQYVSPTNFIGNAIQENQFRYQALVGKRQSDAANSFQSRLGQGLAAAGGMFAGYGMMQGFGSTGLQTPTPTTTPTSTIRSNAISPSLYNQPITLG